MKEEKKDEVQFDDQPFDEQPLPDLDGTQDIGAPLTSVANYRITHTIIPDAAGGIARKDDKIYVLNYQANNEPILSIKRFSLTGVHESNGDITIATPTTPSGGGRYLGGQFGLAYYNNRFYILHRWRRTGGGSDIHQLIEYNTSGGQVSTITLPDSALSSYPSSFPKFITGFYIYNDRIYFGVLTEITSPVPANRSQHTRVTIFNLGSYTSRQGQFTFPINDTTSDFAITDSRIYVPDPTIRAYSTVGSRISGDDTVTGITRGTAGPITIYGSNLYFINYVRGDPHNPGANTIYVYSGAHNIIQWGIPDVDTNRHVSATALFDNAVTVGNTTFKVETSSGATSSGWTITSSGTSTNKVIRAISGSTVSAGTYHLVLNEDAFGINRPSEDVQSPPFTIGAYITPAVATASWSNVAGGSTITGTITFTGVTVFNVESEDFEILNSNDVVQSTGWTISVRGTGSSRTVTGTPDSQLWGDFKLRLKANSVRGGSASSDNSPSSNVDTSAQRVNSFTSLTITWGTPSYCGGSNTVTTTITFDSAVTNFISNDLVVLLYNRGMLEGQISTWTNTLSGTDTTYTITSTPSALTNGVFRFRLGPNLVTYGSRTGPSVNNFSPYFNVDNRLGTGGEQLAAFWSNMVGGPTLSGRITFTGQDVTGIASTDFEARTLLGAATAVTITVEDDEGTAVTQRSAGQSAIVTATPTTTYRIDGQLFLRLKQDSLTIGTGTGPDNHVDSDLTPLNTFTVWGDPTGGTTLTATMTFGASLSRIATTDFEVIDDTDAIQTGWMIEFSPTGTTSRTNGQTLDVICTPPANTADVFRIRLKASSLRHGSGSTDTVPAVAVITKRARVNNLAMADLPLIATWSDMVGGPTLSGRLTFGGQDVSGISDADFEVRTLLGRATAVTIVPSATSATAGQSIAVTATPSSTYRIDGQLFLRLKQDSLVVGTGTGPDENIDSDLTPLNTFTVWGDPTGGTMLSATMTFGATLSRIATTDYEVIDETDTVQSGWTITFNPSGITSRTNNQTLTITATPPARTSDVFRIRLKASSFRHGSASSDTVPNIAVISKRARVNNLEAPMIPETEIPLIATWSNMVGGPTLSGRLTFGGRDVSGISASDFEVRTILGPATAVTIVPSATSATAGQSITVTATPATTYRIDGELLLRLKEDSLVVGSGTGPSENIDSDLTPLNTFTVWGDPTGGTTLSAIMTFGSDIRGISTTDFEIIDQTDEIQSGWTIAFTPDGTTQRTNNQTLTVTATPPTQTTGIFRIRLKATSLRAAAGSTDTIPKIAVITSGTRVDSLDIPDAPDQERSWAFWDNLEGGTTLKGRLHFIGDSITALANTDIEVLLHGTGNRDTNFNITVSSSAVSAGQYVEVEATPLSTYYADGTFRFRLKEDSVMVGSDTAPSENVDSNAIPLNTLLTWGPVSHGSGKRYIESTLTFNSDYIDIAVADFSVLDQTDEVLDDWTITITPSVTTRATGETLVVRGTPSPSRPVYDSFRLQLNQNSIRFTNRQTNHGPTNNLISAPILVATAEAPEPAANVPYLIVEDIPTGTQTGVNVVIDLQAQLNGVAADIDNLRADDFVITSPEGNITPTLIAR